MAQLPRLGIYHRYKKFQICTVSDHYFLGVMMTTLMQGIISVIVDMVTTSKNSQSMMNSGVARQPVTIAQLKGMMNMAILQR